MESTEAYAVCDVGHWLHVPSDGCGCSAVLSQCLCPDIPAGGFLPARWCCWWEVNVRLFKIAPQKELRFPHNVSIRSLLDFYLHFIKIKFKPSLTSRISVTGSRTEDSEYTVWELLLADCSRQPGSFSLTGLILKSLLLSCDRLVSPGVRAMETGE